MANIDKEIQTINTSIYGKDITKSIVDGLNAVNGEVINLSDDQKTFENNITIQIEKASTNQDNFKDTINKQLEGSIDDQNNFKKTINLQMEGSNDDIAAMKEIVENSKETIESAGEINNKITTLGTAIAQNELMVNAEITGVKENSYKENMILNSNFSGDERRGGGIVSNQYGFGQTTTGLRVVKGKTYTFTVGGSISEQAIANGGHLMICLYDTDWSTNGATINITSSNATTQSKTFVATKTEYLYVSSFLAPKNIATKCQSSGGECVVYWYGLVEGSIALNHWTPCSCDLTNGINVFGNSNFGVNGVTTNVNGACWNTSEVELQAGIPYTFTACASIDTNTNGSMALCMLYTDDWSQCPSLYFTPTNQPSVMSITFIPQVTQKFKFGLYSRDAQQKSHGVNCNLKWYTVTQGSKSGAWNPSMLDIKGNTSLQLASLGRMTTQMILAQSTNLKQTKTLGENTTQLLLENNEFKIQNKTLGNHICNLTLENNQLKQQVKSLGHMMIEMQLNK
ncbi:hypothetical protein [uncultured Clostridium sp.]|jgi:hypothetical protein|uniref:hypothetical protein n=1 Tax=uncultured Clostridium sp. TaxID=59620 RepID=UPI002627639B|nr:hypothetical protein [uncultured Clostridium sp.]